MRKLMRMIRFVLSTVKCQTFHKKHHTDVQWELLSWKEKEPRTWAAWTRCEKCGLGWVHSVTQNHSGITHDLPETVLPSMTMMDTAENDEYLQHYGFQTPDGDNPRDQ